MKRLILWCARLHCRIGALIRRCIDKEVVAGDLPQGIYECGASERRQAVKNNHPYAIRTIVRCGDKSWVVISEKDLPSRFAVVKDGPTNRVATSCTDSCNN